MISDIKFVIKRRYIDHKLFTEFQNLLKSAYGSLSIYLNLNNTFHELHLLLYSFRKCRLVSSKQLLLDFCDLCTVFLRAKTCFGNEPIDGFFAEFSVFSPLFVDLHLPFVVSAFARMDLGQMATKWDCLLKYFIAQLALELFWFVWRFETL